MDVEILGCQVSIKRKNHHKRKDRVYFLKQKVSGIVLLACAIAYWIILQELSGFIIFSGLALLLITTKSKILDFKCREVSKNV